MKSLLYLSALACLILPLSNAAPESVSAKPVTIMPLGDSITEGGTGFVVYRYPLMEKLRKAGYNVAYVGSKTTQPLAGSSLGALPHEGYSGQNVAFIKARFAELYRANPADIILLHAGHNQFSDQHPVPGMLKDTRDIIATARSINPKVTVLLGQVITSGKLPKYSYIPEYNQALVALASELNNAKQPVILVNHAAGFNWQTDTITDMVHPNPKGAEKMATNWFDALAKILPPPVKGKTTAAQPSQLPPATNPTPPQSLRLWPGDAPGLIANPGPEVAEAEGRVSNVSVPMLDVYLPPPDKANGTAIIICSGGGYTRLAAGPLGRRAAEIFGAQGYAVFSLKYRVRPPSTDVVVDAVADARRAVRIVRNRAPEWKIAPDRIGLVGFSAGANLILNLATTQDTVDPTNADPLSRVSSRPDFIGLAATWHNNQKITSFTIDGHVPPAFILHARDDTVAPFQFGEELAAAWKRSGTPFAFLPYEKGGHMAFNFPAVPAGDWTDRFVDWLRQLPTNR
ncbi:MAG TPA: GDSL-type esterase/lipase family protein [Rariglobus sp.]|nr:GDSL-type esterase/lipase family protein [Rariglobus sp.]